MNCGLRPWGQGQPPVLWATLVNFGPLSKERTGRHLEANVYVTELLRRVPRPLFVGLSRFRRSEPRAYRDGNFGGPHLGHATDMTQLSAIEKVTISANDFYWGSAFKLSGAPSFKGLGTARPKVRLWKFTMEH
jgi:hypothetical protein